jgi:hypothetical protein
MASTDKELRREVVQERERLAEAVGGLREEIDNTKRTVVRVSQRVAIVASVSALGIAFVKAVRRVRKSNEKEAAGRRFRRFG